jgi:hypothetical protein
MSSFTLQHYEDTLKDFLKYGYELDNSCLKNSSSKDLQLVHDIDFDPELTVKIAKIEKEVGAKSTFFFRLKAANYNLLSIKNVKIVHDLIKMGHNVGLHYEQSNKLINSFEEDISFNLNVASNLLGTKISLFNAHEPSRTGIKISDILPYNNRCYNSEFFKDYKYLSDSGGRWREGCFSEHLNSHKKILVLTHPIWWYEQHPGENY